MSNKKLIPELRFPEFKNAEEWEVKRISQLGETINGLTGKSGEDFGTGKPYVTYKQVFANSIIDFDKCGKVLISENENQNTLEKGDILFTTSSETPNEVGYASVLVESPIEPTYLNSFCFSIRPFNIEETQPQFSRYLFHSPLYRKSVSALAQGSTRYNLSKGAFLNLKLPIPKPPEQQKIASCLSSLDEVIAAHNQKLDVLKHHKKGLMQNLFPQSRLNCDSFDSNDENDFKNQSNQENHKNHSSDNIPKYRFKEFENDGGEWVEKKLGEVAIFLKGKGISKSDIVEGGNLPCIRYGELYTHYKETIDAIKSFTNLSSNELVLSESNDVIIPASGETQIDIATASCVLKSGIALGGDLNIIRSGIDGVFLAYYLNSAKKSDIAQLAQGISVVHLYPSQLQTLSISFPKNQKEQQKIASCLSSLDALITAQAKRIEQLKIHKKGLMQGLFPKMSE